MLPDFEILQTYNHGKLQDLTEHNEYILKRSRAKKFGNGVDLKVIFTGWKVNRV